LTNLRESLRAQAFAATSGFRERDHRDIRNAEGFESVPLKLGRSGTVWRDIRNGDVGTSGTIWRDFGNVRFSISH